MYTTNDNSLTCLTLGFLVLMLGITLRDKLQQTNLLQNIPKHYTSRIFPAVLIDGNWTCSTRELRFKTFVQNSRMEAGHTWWKKCQPPEKCLVIDTWMNREYDSSGTQWNLRYIRYAIDKLVSSRNIVSSSRDKVNYDFSKMFNNEWRWINDQLTWNIRTVYQTSNCLGTFTFRNVKNGNYFVENTYDHAQINYFMSKVGGLYRVGVFDPCRFSLFWDELPRDRSKNKRVGCIFYLKPINMTSYDLWNK